MSVFRKTPLGRLALLVPWVNGDGVPQLRLQLAAFLGSFDGSAGAGHLQVHMGRAAQGGTTPRLERARDLSEAMLEDVRARVIAVLRTGFPLEPRLKDVSGGEVEAFPSLRFGVGRLRAGDRSTAGAYTVVVDGALRDIVPFLVIHLLTTPGMATLTRCPAPTANNWTERCGRFVITHGKGRPRVFCSEACRVRHHAEVLKHDRDKSRAKRKKYE